MKADSKRTHKAPPLSCLGSVGCFEEPAFSVLRPHLAEAQLSAGKLLKVAGEMPDFIYIPIDCLISFTSTDGVEVLSLGQDGLSFPELALDGMALPLDAVVSVPGRALSIETSKLHALSAVNDAVRTGLARACHEAVCQAALVSRARAKLPVMVILTRWLHRCCEVTGRASVAITHVNLARLLGMRRQTITTSLAELEQLGLIATRRKSINVCDIEGLALFEEKLTP